jgi:AcrR family transcriptional regulator
MMISVKLSFLCYIDPMSTAVLDLAPGKGVRTRQAILDEAIAQFAAVGQQGASVSRIARQVGLNPSAVYVYFPSKQALFEAAIDTDAAGLIADALPELLAGTFDGHFGRVFLSLLNCLPAHPLARRVLEGKEGTGVERLAQLPSELRLHQGLISALRMGQKDGSVRSDIDPELCAIGLEAIVVALLIAILQTGGDADPRSSAGVLAVLDASIHTDREASLQTRILAHDRP